MENERFKKISDYHPRISATTLAFMALMIAVQFLLERILCIESPINRWSLNFLGRAVSGACFGPIPAAIIGVCADLIGTFSKGDVINPGITAVALFRGLAYGFLLFRKQNVPRLVIAAVLDQIVGSLVLITLSLIYFGGITPSTGFLTTRVVQTLITLAFELLVLIYTRKYIFPPLIRMTRSDKITK